MTVIESAAVCTTRRVRDDASYFIPVQEVFEGAPGDGWSGATEVVPGPDAAAGRDRQAPVLVSCFDSSRSSSNSIPTSRATTTAR